MVGVKNIRITSSMISDFSTPVSKEENKNKYLKVDDSNKIIYQDITEVFGDVLEGGLSDDFDKLNDKIDEEVSELKESIKDLNENMVKADSEIEDKLNEFKEEQTEENSNLWHRCEELDDRLDEEMENISSALDDLESDYQSKIDDINNKIPSEASATNQLADKEFVNSSITNMAARRVYADENQGYFPTRASLLSASTFYDGQGNEYEPSHNDYTIVFADESAPAPYTGGQTRWIYAATDEWEFNYGINNTPFTASQMAAIDSTITKEKVAKFEKKVDQVTTSNKVYGTDASGNQTTYDYNTFGKVDDVQVGGTTVVSNKIANLGTMASKSSGDYYTKTESDNNFAKDSSVVHTSGNETIGGNKTFTGSITFNQTIQGTALKALWADLAEYYESDSEYPKGTLVQFGGEKEITIATSKVNAVITSEPGFILNSGLNGQAIALTGRVPVRVIGKVNKFDEIVMSETLGVGRVKQNDSEKTIAIALKSNDDENEKLVLCVTKLDF